MDWTEIEAHWDGFKPQLQDRWGRLTDEDIRKARGGRDQLIACVIKRYRIDPEVAQRHVKDWLNSASRPKPGHADAEPRQTPLDNQAAHSNAQSP